MTEAWDAMLDSQPRPTPHLRSWWLRAGARGLPQFVVVLDQGRLIGGIAFEVDKWRGVSRGKVMASKSWPSGFDMIAEPDRAGEVVEALTDWMRSSSIQLFDLSGIDGDARLPDVLPGTVRRQESGNAWIIDLPSDFDQYLAAKSKNFRKDLSRARRRVDDAGLVARRVPAVETERALETLQRLHQSQFGDESTFLPFFPEFAKAAPQGAAGGEVVFFELVDGKDQIVEIGVWLRLGRGVWDFVGGRQSNAVSGTGNVLRAWAIERFCEEGVSRVDLGGGYGYWKRSWATGRRTQLHIVAMRGLMPRLSFGVSHELHRIKKLVMGSNLPRISRAT